MVVAPPATGRWPDHQQVSGLDVLGPRLFKARMMLVNGDGFDVFGLDGGAVHSALRVPGLEPLGCNCRLRGGDLRLRTPRPYTAMTTRRS